MAEAVEVAVVHLVGAVHRAVGRRQVVSLQYINKINVFIINLIIIMIPCLDDVRGEGEGDGDEPRARQHQEQHQDGEATKVLGAENAATRMEILILIFYGSYGDLCTAARLSTQKHIIIQFSFSLKKSVLYALIIVYS